MKQLSIDKLVVDVLDYVRKDYDFHINVSGQNGVGKTSFALYLAKLFSEYDPTRTIRFIIDKQDLKKVQPREICVIDEGETLLGIRDTHQVTGRFINFIKLIRFYNNIFITNSISPIHLAKEYREHKVKLIFYLFDRGKGVVFGIHPTLPSKYFHETLETVFSKGYVDAKQFLDEVSDIPYTLGYIHLHINKEEIYELYERMNENKRNIIQNYRL